MYKKNVSAETKQLLILILSYPQQGVNMISSSQCYSQTMEEYEHTAAMLVKVARVENTDHADLMRLKQDVMALSVGYEVEVTTVQSSPAGGQRVLQLAVLRPDTGQREVRVHHRHADQGGEYDPRLEVVAAAGAFVIEQLLPGLKSDSTWDLK